MTSNSDFTPAVGQGAHENLAPSAASTSGEPQPARKQASRAIREIVETLLLAALIFLLVRLVVLNFRVDGESMLPNLDNGQMLLVNRNAYLRVDVGGNQFYPFDPPERGDVVVFEPPTNSDKPYIKRIIGLPGEEITFGQGHVFVDGVQLPEDYIQDRTRCNREDRCDVVVPEGHVFVLGDHRSNSSDSRVFGVVPIENIVGKAWVSYWPPNDIGFVPHEDYTSMSELPATSGASSP